MGMLSGYKSGEDMVLLDNNRRVAVSRVWALRLIAVVLVLTALARAGAGGVASSMGVVIGAGVVYLFGLHIASHKTA